MGRRLGLLVIWMALCLTANGIARAAGQKAGGEDNDHFTFLDISDTHQKAGEVRANLRKFSEEAAHMSPKPAFVIHTGDVTETGAPEEYAKFREATAPLRQAGIKIYAVPGSHDIRWSGDGKETFLREFGKTYQSFDQAGTHFVLLDTTVALEHWGHIDKAQIDWLARDLKKLKPETPVFVFMHHWIGRDSPLTRMVDNEFELRGVLRKYNVVAIFTGHNHRDLVWRTGGVRTLMAEGLFQPHGSYYRVNVSKLIVGIDRQFIGTPGDTYHTSLPLSRQSHPSKLKVEWDDNDNPFLARRWPKASLYPRAVTDNPDKELAEYRLDEGPYKPLTKDIRDIWKAPFETKGMAIGVHTADVRLTTSNDITYEEELFFEVERDNKEPTQKWAINLDGPIQSSPLLVNDLLYVGALDGKCYALETAKGKRHWTFTTRGQFYGSPISDGTSLYLGSTDHEFYAIDAGTGKPHWHFNAGGPLFSTAAVAKEVVCFGGNGKIYGLNIATGKPAWTQPAGGFFQSRATTDGNTFYLGGWDNTVYALDAASGDIRWTAKMGVDRDRKLDQIYSPAISSPVVADGRCYICSMDGILHALNAKTGKEIWTTFAPTGADPFGYSTPVQIGNRLYLAGLGKSGDVYCLDTADGHIVWRVSTGQIIYDSSLRLAPDGKSFAIMGLRGHVSVLDTQTGSRLWGYELGPGNIFSTCEYDGQHLYTTTMANDVQAINAPGVRSNDRRENRPATKVEE